MSTAVSNVTMEVFMEVFGSKIQIDVMNRSTVLSDDQIVPVVAALQRQVSEHFSPAWGIDADLYFVGLAAQSDPTHWQLGIFDNSDQAGALGYHDLTAAGMPIGKVFAKTDLDFGSSWSVTTSHELLEMLADPDIDQVVFAQQDVATGKLYAYEVADPCEADEFGYQIDGVLVSDFVLPGYFVNWQTSAQYDWGRHITSMLSLLPGGYYSVFAIPNDGTGWIQVDGDKVPAEKKRAPVGSRRERRARGKDNWRRSEV